MEQKKPAIIIGGGLAGLSCCMKLAELGICVHLVSLCPAKRSHSVCAQGGINAAFDSKKEGDSPEIHAYETIKGGDFLADQPPVVEMCLTAPRLIELFERMGCPFNRTPEGHLDVRRFGGTLFSRTVFCGSSTGQQLVYTADEQVRRLETLGLVRRYEHHEFLRLIQDEEGNACGIVMHDLFTLELLTLEADVIINASGSLGVLFGKSTNSCFCTGAANGRLYMQGMRYANPEFIQIHPTAIPGDDKLRLMSESIRGEGGRIWVWGDSARSIVAPDGKTISCGKTGEPWYFLEEMYPVYKNLVPRDIAARELLRICEMGMGIDGGMQVYLDIRHLSEEKMKKLAAVTDLYEKFTGEDPRKKPMRIFPAVHYSMGGAWVDWPAHDDTDRMKRFRQMSSLRGCFVIGEADFEYHGANRLGANSLLSCIFAGFTAAQEAFRYISEKTPSKGSDKESALFLEWDRQKKLLSSTGVENVFSLHEELGSLLVSHVTVQRNNADLEKTLASIFALRDRYKDISLSDTSATCNQAYVFAHRFEAMLELALAITRGALLRNESRGSHAKKEFPERNDKDWLVTTIASYTPSGPEITYIPVDTRYLKPTRRDYSTASHTPPPFENFPKDAPLVV